MKLIAEVLLLSAAAFAFTDLKIVAPASLASAFQDKPIETKPSLFGFSGPTHVTAPLIVPDPTNWEGCYEHDSSLPQFQASARGFVLFLKRGVCTYVTKVRNAEKVGAKAVLLVNIEDDSHPLPFLADDGSGSSLKTPALIVPASVGARINASLLLDSETVVVSMGWGIPNPKGLVHWNFWTSSFDPNSLIFKENFASVVSSLGEKVDFTPQYYFLRGEDFGCVSSGQICGNQCTNGGRYCAVDPEHDVNTGISGADVVRENLRQICVSKYSQATAQKQLLWWNYVTLFNKKCAQSANDFNSLCADQVLASLNIPVAAIQDCIATSGGYGDTDASNVLIDQQINERIDQGVYLLPTIAINDEFYRGSLECPQPVNVNNCGVFYTICAGFADEPDFCKVESVTPAPVDPTTAVPASTSTSSSEVVELVFWASSFEEAEYKAFRENFGSIVPAFGNRVVFTPKYYFLQGENFGCEQSARVCGNQCSNSGWYCSIDPEHDIERGISGADVVRENLREICLFKYANSTTPKQTGLWWDYVSLFQKNCGGSFQTDCSNKVLQELKVPVSAIESCVASSGGYGDADGKNSLMTEEIQQRIDQGVFLLPTFLINGEQYRGSFNCPQPVDARTCGVLSAVCAKFSSQPEFCKTQVVPV